MKKDEDHDRMENQNYMAGRDADAGNYACGRLPCVETYYRPVLRGKASLSLLPWIVEHVYLRQDGLAFPLFLAISGALLLKREYRVKDFYKKSLIPLLLTTEIWIVLNYLFVCSPVKNDAFHLPELFQEMLFLKDSSLSHMWYMPVILGIYLVVAFLSEAAEKLGRYIRVPDIVCSRICGIYFASNPESVWERSLSGIE